MANEKRLIDANALIAYFKEQCEIASKDSEIESLYTLAALKCCIDYFEHFPTVDAVEVVHGRWEGVDHDGSWRVDRCSVCHRRMHYVDYDQPYQYCPNCGAKMDGDGNG